MNLYEHPSAASVEKISDKNDLLRSLWSNESDLLSLIIDSWT